MIRALSIFVLLCLSVPAWAEPVLTSEAKGCTRASLQKATAQYLEALKKGNPSSMPLASGAKYIERRKEMPLGQGLWQKPFPSDFSRSIFDVDICESFTEIIQANSDHPYVVGTRLKVANGKIEEIESLASDDRDWLFDAKGYLKYSPGEKWDLIPPEKRTSRQALIKVASDYFDIFQDYSAFDKIPWSIPCARIEGGLYTNADNHPNPS
jgi:hypothetical protein